MESYQQLDLCGMLKPYCLLQCKSVLASMEPGAILEVRIGDPETCNDLLKILERSGERVLSRTQRGQDFVVRVRRRSSEA